MTMTTIRTGVPRSMRVVLGATALTVAAGVAPPLLAQSPGPWKPLFNGKDLTGWTVAAGRGGGGGGGGTGSAPAPAPTPANWKVEDGVLVGGQGGGRGSLVSNDQYKDFELELEFMLAEHGSGCSAELIGPEQANASKDRSCLYNSGISFRTGYQVNIGRREAGEYVGVVVHRKAPGAIRGNVLWLDRGDDKFPNLRKKENWNQLRISAKGPQLTVFLNGTKICDVKDDPTDPAEAKWKEAGPISLQWPPAGESGGWEGFVKYRNVRIREL
jgi:3-keto-disaccharide hydrolase